MTDKQIIIDGVDVSGCEYIIPPHEQCPNKPMPYAKETSCFACKEHNTKLNFCKNNPNCYYKEYKRSEAQSEAMFVTHTDLEKKYKAKEQECERLKRDYFTVIQQRNIAEQQLDKLKTEVKSKTEYIQEQRKIINQCSKEIEMYKKCQGKRASKREEELKAENDLAKQLINWILKFFELTHYDWQEDQNEISALIEDYIDDKNSTIDFVNDINKSLFKKLTEIKEIAENVQSFVDITLEDDVFTEMNKILHKISEVE